jgi:hypothetical protein
MDTTTSVLLTGVIVAIGRWVNDQKLTPRIAIGVVILALFLSLMGQSQPRLASRFAALILIVAVVGYAPSILDKLGYPITNPSKWRGSMTIKAPR